MVAVSATEEPVAVVEEAVGPVVDLAMGLAEVGLVVGPVADPAMDLAVVGPLVDPAMSLAVVGPLVVDPAMGLAAEVLVCVIALSLFAWSCHFEAWFGTVCH